MILDVHIHVTKFQPDQATLMTRMRQAGVDGGVILSAPPACFPTFDCPKDARQRLDNLLAWTAGQPQLYPFFWMDPTEPDALGQVQMALEAQVAGFKIICNHFYPSEAKAVDVYRAIAKARRPVLFHSGTCWDGTPSSKYCRPVEFEVLLEVPGIRFALAHIGWPWVDECLSVYGKFQNSKHNLPELSCEMFIDISPGTPPIYRRDALTKIFTIGYDVKDNVLFGTDSTTGAYAVEWIPTLIKNDNAIYESIGVEAPAREKIYETNLRRFLGR